MDRDDAIDLDDIGISPRILKARKTGVVEPLGPNGLMLMLGYVPQDLEAMGVAVEPDAIVQRLRAEIEKGVEAGKYKWPLDQDFQEATAPELLEALIQKYKQDRAADAAAAPAPRVH